MRKVELTMNENEKYQIIKKLVETNGNKKRAAVKLGCTVRSVNRLIAKYKASGKQAFSHGNHRNKPSTTISQDKRNEIITLYENKYFDSNLRHFTELLKRQENIEVSEGSVRSILLNENILSPKAHKSTKRALKKKLEAEKANVKSKKIQTKIQEELVMVDDPHLRRERCAYFGEMLQMDASLHLWFGDKKATLHAAIDDATGTIVGAFFDKQETLFGYYNVFKQVLEEYGIPYMFYTDRRTVFDYKKSNSKDVSKNTLTQFGYACKQLGVELKVTSIAQAKGRIERLFGTLQSRLPIEFRLAGIQTIEQANEFLKSYLKEFNAKFALPVNSTKSVFEIQPDKEKINLILSVISERKVDSGHCIKYNNKYYKLVDDQGSTTCYYSGTPVIVARTFNGELYANVNDRTYVLDEVKNHEEVSRYFDTKAKNEEAKKPKQRYIPSMNHPWKKDNFMKFVHMFYGREEDMAS